MTDVAKDRIARSSYGEVAREYYDPGRHPTCANFRWASRRLLEQLVPDVPPSRSCEVGAGSSLLAEIFWDRNRDVREMLITDLNPGMLEYSRKWEDEGAILRQASAFDLPLAAEGLSLLVASLADPYDDDRFWREAARVLRPAGRCVVTTPSATWANAFRGEGDARRTADFELRDGRVVRLPSYVREPDMEKELIEGHGLHLIQHAEIPREALAEPVSKKLAFLEPSDPVVHGFVAERPA